MKNIDVHEEFEKIEKQIAELQERTKPEPAPKPKEPNVIIRRCNRRFELNLNSTPPGISNPFALMPNGIATNYEYDPDSISSKAKAEAETERAAALINDILENPTIRFLSERIKTLEKRFDCLSSRLEKVLKLG